MPSGLILSEGETPYLHLLAVESDDGIEKLYEEISEILHQEGRDQVNAIVMGDNNSIVGNLALAYSYRKTARSLPGLTSPSDGESLLRDLEFNLCIFWSLY